MSGLKGHPVYRQALAAVNAHRGVAAEVGVPVQPGHLVQGGTRADGAVEMMFSVTGQKPGVGAGVRVVAEPEPGERDRPADQARWVLRFLDVGANLANGSQKVFTLVEGQPPQRF